MAFKLPGLSLGGTKAAPLSIMGTVADTGVTQDSAALPMLRGKSAAEQLRILRIPFLIFAILTTAMVLYQIRVSSFGTAYVAGAGQMRTLSQQIAKASQLALQGEPNAFGELEQSRAQFNQLLAALTNGGDINGGGKYTHRRQSSGCLARFHPDRGPARARCGQYQRGGLDQGDGHARPAANGPG